MLVDKFFEKNNKPKVSYKEFKEKNYNNLYKFNNPKKNKNYSRLKLCIGVIIIIGIVAIPIIKICLLTISFKMTSALLRVVILSLMLDNHD